VLGVGCWVLGVGCWVLGIGCLAFGFVLDVQVLTWALILTWVLTFRGITTAEEVNILGWPAMDGGTRER